MNKSILSLLTLLLVLFAVSCSKNDPSVNATRLRISLTDAPLSSKDGDVIITELNVDIEKIEVSMVDSVDSSVENWVTLTHNGELHNVLSLTNGKQKQIVDQYFPTGVLRQLRITFGGNSNMKANGVMKDVVLDPSARDGIVFDVNANLYANYISNIILDLNAALSLHEDNGNFIFNPSIRVFAEASTGSLKGYALPQNANPIVVITNKIDTLLTMPEFTDGLFVFMGLSAGEWDIHVLSDPALGYRDSIFSDTVYIGQTTDLSKIMLRSIEEDTDEGEGEGEGEDGDDGKGDGEESES